MKTFALALALLAPLLAFDPYAAKADEALRAQDVNAAQFEKLAGEERSPMVVKAQVLLDRADFSPGVIDGWNGDNFRKALTAYQKQNGLGASGQLDKPTWDKLTRVFDGPAMTEYKITKDDVDGPFVGEIPHDYRAMAKLDRLGFHNPAELLAEKFHMDEELLHALNRGTDFKQAGTTIAVANVPRGDPSGEVSKIVVNKTDYTLRAYGQDGKLLAFYPATVGSEEKPAPTGDFKVRAVAMDPTYTYNPDYNFKGQEATEKVTVPPGPNGPVGTVWIDLTLDGYGIHGTPEPDKISKSYSHGCVRLTNWDARALAKRVKKGVPVIFTN